MQPSLLRAFARGPTRGNVAHRSILRKATLPVARVAGKGPRGRRFTSISQRAVAVSGTACDRFGRFLRLPGPAFRQFRLLPRFSLRPRFSQLPGRNFTSNFGRRAVNGKGATKTGRGPATVEPLSLSARLKKLSREYGWVAIGVYFGLSVLDFPFCFLLVRAVGTQKIGEVEHWVVSKVQNIVPQSIQEKAREIRQAFKKMEKDQTGDDNITEDVEMAGWGVEEATERYNADASLATQLALAYAIHKSFIFARIPLTVGITPKVVKVLRGWGWQIGKRKTASRRRWLKR